MKYSNKIPFAALFVTLLGVVSLFMPLWPNPDRWLWADNFDGYLIIWILEWGHHILFESLQPLKFWQANSFYPQMNSLAFSESLLSAQIIYGPLRMAGFSILTSMYATFALTIVAAACVTDYGLQRLKIKTGSRILFLLVAHFSLPIVSFLYHYQMFAFQLAPPFFLWTYIFFTQYDRNSFHIAATIYVISSCYSTYLAVAMPITALPAIVYLLAIRIKSVGLRQCLIQDLKIASTIPWLAVYLSILYFVCLKFYIHAGHGFDLPSYMDIKTYAAKPSSFLNDKSPNSLWYSPGGYKRVGDWERSYFPGYVLLVVFFSVVITTARKTKREAIHESIPAHLLSVSLITFFTAYVLSLGPFLRGSDFPMPYWIVSEALPSFRNMRTPGRFGAFLTFPLAVFCIVFARYFSQSLRVKTGVLVATLIVTIGIESLPKFQVFPYELEGDSDYQALQGKVREGTPLVIFPTDSEDHYKKVLGIIHQLIGAKYYWGRLPVGYGSKETPIMMELLELERSVNQGRAGVESLVDFSKNIGIHYIYIRLPALNEQTRQAWLKLSAKNSEASENIGNNLLIKL